MSRESHFSCSNVLSDITENSAADNTVQSFRNKEERGKIKALNLSKCCLLSSTDLQHIINMCSHSLEALVLAELDALRDCSFLKSVYGKCKNLKSLEVFLCDLSDEGANNLEFSPVSTSLTQLSLHKCAPPEESLTQFIFAMPNLQSLDLWGKCCCVSFFNRVLN